MKKHRNSPCECHYAGTTPSLTPTAVDLDESAWSEFDSSYKRGSPTTFAPNQVIKGWTEAMQLMVEGDKWEMYIPSELAYGNSDRGPKIKAGDVLIFRMELLKIMGNKHDVTGIRVYDKREEEMPNVGMVQMQDEETGELIWVNTCSKSVRTGYAKYFRDRADYFQSSFRLSGSGSINTRTDESYVKKLLGYFKQRG